MIHIQIPATSANMGPGFDSIGVAVQLYNHIWVEEQTDGLTIEVRRKQELEVPTDETNLIYQTMKFFYEKKELPMPGIHLIKFVNELLDKITLEEAQYMATFGGKRAGRQTLHQRRAGTDGGYAGGTSG